MAAAIALLALPCQAEPDLPHPDARSIQRHPRFYGRPLYRPPAVRLPHGAPLLLVAPPGRFMPPSIGRPSLLHGDQLPSAPLSGGFHLTVALGHGLKAPEGTLARAFEVGQALGACWAPPDAMTWKIITIRLSFKRDGSVNGEPRIPFTDAGSVQRNSDLAHSLLAALKHCTPLPFSPSLGSAIAGEIFAISFTHQDQR